MGKSLYKGYVLVPLLFNILFATIRQVTFTHLKADKDAMDALVGLKKKTGAGDGEQ